MNIPAAMATQDTTQASPTNHHVGKRKFLADGNGPAPKKRRAVDPRTETKGRSPTLRSAPATTSNYSRVYGPLLAKLSGKFEVKSMSVMPSTSISRHVDHGLEHLGRFSAWDQTVLPGVVLLCAKSAASGKLVTIAELIRRRIGENDQKWFQYNVLSEAVLEEATQQAEEPSAVEVTYMAVDREREDKGVDDEYFEAVQPTIHEQAVLAAKVRYKAHMTVLLSRVPLHELKTEKNVSLQTNEQQIEYLRRKRMGLSG